MSTQVKTRKEVIMLLAMEVMIELAEIDAWAHVEGFDDALTDAQEAVRIARLDHAD